MLAKVEEKQVLDLLASVESADIKPYEDTELAESLITDMPKAGAIIKQVKNDALGTMTMTLVNGATVVYKKTDFKDDEVLMEAFSYGGSSLYSDADFLKIGVANRGLTEAGVNGLNKTELGKMMSGKIARVRPFIGQNSEGLSGNIYTKRLRNIISINTFVLYILK